jgi:hypothetical protein
MNQALGETPRLGMIRNRGHGKYFSVKSRSMPALINFNYINAKLRRRAKSEVVC